MAARRLVIVMLVLLFVTSLAAALIPVQAPVDDAVNEEKPTNSAPSSSVGNDTAEPLEATIKVGKDEEPPVIAVDVGDQLRLEVISRTTATVQLVGLGPTDDVDRFDPALFDVLLTEEGTYPVRFLESRKRIGTIEVSEPANSSGESSSR